MSRQKTEINPIRAERLKTLISREKLKQNALANMIFQSQQNISRIIQLKQPLTEETAKDIINAVNESTGKHYRIEWLLGYDDTMTIDELKHQVIKRIDDVNKAVMTILDASVREVCAREGISPLPVIDNPVEGLFLEAQLRDFADSIVWNYIKHREHSHLWTLLDHDPNNPK